MAAGVSFLAAIVLGSRMIAWLNRRFREPDYSPLSAEVRELHQRKQWRRRSTRLIFVAGCSAAGSMGDLSNQYLPIVLATLMSLAALGAADDLIKLSGRGDGLERRTKLAGQAIIALVAALLLYGVQRQQPGGLDLVVPLVGRVGELGWLFVPLSMLVMVGSSNAVNLTDGLDGLAGGCMLFATAAMTLWSYAGRTRPVGRVPPRAAHCRLRRAGRAGRGDDRRGGRLPLVQLPSGAGVHGRHRLAAAGRAAGLHGVVARQELLLVLIGGVFVARRRASCCKSAGSVAAAADLPLRPAAPSFSVPRLAGKQDRRPLLDRRRALRLLGLATLKANSSDRNPAAANRMAARELPVSR